MGYLKKTVGAHEKKGNRVRLQGKDLSSGLF